MLHAPPEVDVVIEVPRGSFLKRGSTGSIDFVSLWPCPYNYGSAPLYIGMEGDLLDAVVLGPRLALGARVRVQAWGAIVMRDRDMIDDKLVCGTARPTARQRAELLRFFHRYARCKGLLNRLRRSPGRNACEGWIGAEAAIARARVRDATWRGPAVSF